MRSPILYCILGMAKLTDTLQLTKSIHSTKCVLEKRTFILHSATKHFKKSITALLRGATLTYKYETRIINASNLQHSRKEVIISPERPEEWQIRQQEMYYTDSE